MSSIHPRHNETRGSEKAELKLVSINQNAAGKSIITDYIKNTSVKINVYCLIAQCRIWPFHGRYKKPQYIYILSVYFFMFLFCFVFSKCSLKLANAFFMFHLINFTITFVKYPYSLWKVECDWSGSII